MGSSEGSFAAISSGMIRLDFLGAMFRLGLLAFDSDAVVFFDFGVDVFWGFGGAKSRCCDWFTSGTRWGEVTFAVGCGTSSFLGLVGWGGFGGRWSVAGTR